MITGPGGYRLEYEVRLTPLMIARLFGVPVGDEPEMKDSEDEPSDARRPVGDPLVELEDRDRAKGSTTASVTIGLVVIGMMMVAVGALLILPINLSLEHARIMGGLAFFAVGVSVIFSATRKHLTRLRLTMNV
jgi:hypothetical protein